MILVTGTTGKYGRLVVDQLVAAGDPGSVIAAARRPDALADLAAAGVAVRHLDYNDPATLATALDGVSQVLLVSSSEIGARIPQHAAVIDAAVAAGVEHLAYTSLLRADTSTILAAIDHRATEELLADAPITTTRLRNGWYIENYTEQLGPALANGAFVGSAGGGRVAAATRADYAAAGAAVLLDRSHWGNTYELAGEGFTMSELAAAVSAHAGRDLPYVDLPPADLAGILAGAGLPAPLVEFLVSADLGIASGELDAPSDVLSALIGRAPTTLDDVLATLSWPA
jgi:NAD(P)H dehydrogenase (quinone)